MPGIITPEELDGLRTDMELLLGIDELDQNEDAVRTVISFYRPDPSAAFDPDTLTYGGTPTSLYSGPATIGPMVFRRDRQESGGEEAVRVRVYRCLVPWDASPLPRIDDYAIVDECDDPNITNRTFLVTDVMFESDLAARRITLTDTTRDSVG